MKNVMLPWGPVRPTLFARTTSPVLKVVTLAALATLSMGPKAHAQESAEAPPSTVEAAPATAEVAGRQLIILKQGLNQLWGSLVMAVLNETGSPARVKAHVMLPEQTTDWRPQEGVEPGDIQLASEGGGLVFEREFPPGTTLVSIGFVVPAKLGRANMTLRAPSGLEELSVLVPIGKLQVVSDMLTPGKEERVPGNNFEAWLSNKEIAVGQEFRIEVLGVAEGRTRFWYVGALAGALILVGGALMTWKTRPATGDQEELPEAV